MTEQAKTVEERVAIAEAVGKALDAGGDLWTRVWAEGEHVRVYLKYRNRELGYLEIDNDGDAILFMPPKAKALTVRGELDRIERDGVVTWYTPHQAGR